MDTKIIVVAGATGNQGGAVARKLLADGWQVRAISRDPAKPAAKALADLGAEIVAATFEDAASLERALDGAYGAFSVQNMMKIGTEREAQQGIAFADAAKKAGIQHLVYSSVGGADRKTGIGHFESKWRVEEHIRQLGVPATIVRPVFFTENLLARGPVGFVFWGAVAGALKKDRTLQVISLDDIAGFVALAFANPERYLGKAIEIAGDEVSLADAMAAYRRVKGKRPWFLPLPNGLLKRMDEDLGAMFRWFRESGYQADIPALKQQLPTLRSFEDGLRHGRPASM